MDATPSPAVSRRQPWLWLAAAALLLPMLAACGKGEQSQAAVPQGNPPPAIPVTVVRASPQSIPIALDVVGQTEGSKEVEVRARVGGILQKRLYSEGATVRAGQPLFQIDRAPYEIALEQAKAALAQERARSAQAQREADRLKPLVEQRAVSRKEYDDATSTQQLSQASQQQFAARVREAELNLSYTLVTAPVPGISGRAEHSEGSLITTDANGSLLTTINQLNPMYVRFSVSESDLAKMPGGRLATGVPVDVKLSMPDGTPYPGKGRLNFTGAVIDPKLGTQQLRAEFDNPKGELLPGQFVRVKITAGQRNNVFLVPQVAVMQTEKGYFVFVVDAGNNAEIRPVQVGDWVGSDWTVLSGLNTGDRVVADNLLKVRPGVAVAPTEAKVAAVGDTPASNNGTSPASAAGAAATGASAAGGASKGSGSSGTGANDASGKSGPGASNAPGPAAATTPTAAR